MKLFKIIALFTVVFFIASINYMVVVNANDSKSCSTGLCLTARDEGNLTPNNAGGGNQSLPAGANDTDIIAPTSPDYNGSQIKKLAVPIGVVAGVILGSIVVIIVWRWCFKSEPKGNVK